MTQIMHTCQVRKQNCNWHEQEISQLRKIGTESNTNY